MSSFPVLRLAYLYARLMNLYSDRGNIVCLVQRCRWRGLELQVVEVGPGEEPDFRTFDLVFMGGGEDRQQSIAAADLVRVKGASLRAALTEGLVALTICGGYQLFGRYYRPAQGDDLPGLGFFKLRTEHPGSAVGRCVGNVAARAAGGWLVGFENHGGRTFLEGSQPLATVAVGCGNNGKDGTEGAIEGNAIGTYLHGSLLPKNPGLADDLLRRALLRRGEERRLPPLDDSLEVRAQTAMLTRLRIGTKEKQR
jgi:CobQ-like glutamine amidotransferase family enzyme